MLVHLEAGQTLTLRRRTVILAVASILFSLESAVACNLIVEVLQVGGDVGYVLDTDLGTRLPLFALGTSLVWVLILLAWSLTGRLTYAVAICSVGAILIGYANYKKLSLRGEPIYPSDFDFVSSPGFLGQMVSTSELLVTLTLATSVVTVVLLSGRMIRRKVKRPQGGGLPRRWLWVTRAVTAALCLSTLAYAHNFNDSGNRFRAAYESSGAHWKFWYQNLNYRSNGFVAGFLYNTQVPAMSVPPGYGRARMHAISQKYARRAAAVNADRDSAALSDVNVVLVLSEAFSDPTALSGSNFARDPIPKTRALMQRTLSGNMLSQFLGGGTANMEFEVLTGMSLAQFDPQMNSPYQMLVPDYQAFPSAVGYFRQLGHDAIAVHPYMTSMYKREEVYPILGFQDFVADKDMESTETLGDSEFISDRAAFGEVESRIARSTTPLLVNLVTMQNHYPMADLYPDPIAVTGLTGEEEEEASGYARGLEYTDQALATFLKDLRHSSEKTAVVFYGDHLPAFWSKDTQARNGLRRMRETPFFIWTNFKELPHTWLPTTSPIQFLPMLFDAIGAPLPPYYALLRDLQEEIPAMEQGEFVNSDDEMVLLEELSPRARALLRDYRLVQYDLSVGRRFSQAGMFYAPVPNTSSASK